MAAARRCSEIRAKNEQAVPRTSAASMVSIRRKIVNGVKRLRTTGTKLGRSRVSRAIERRIGAARGEGKGIRKIAAEVGVGVGTVKRVVDKAA